MADMDSRLREPKAIHVKSGMYGISMWYAPSALRPLTKEELEQVDNFRDQVNPPRIKAADRPDVGATPAGENPEASGGSERGTDTEGEGRPEEGNI